MSTTGVRRWPLTGRGAALEAVDGALSDPAAVVFLTGPAGVGKTRLAEELVALRTADGSTTQWLTCSPGTAPLALFAPLVPRLDPVSAFAQVRDAVVGDQDAPTVLVVDDVEHADEASAGLLLGLVESGAVRLVVTMTDGAAPPPALATLWRSGRAHVVAVAGLDAFDVDTLLHRVLGGVVDGRAVADFLEISRGNVLFLRELVTGSLESGVLDKVDDVWRLTGRPTGTPMLTTMVRRRIASLDDEARAVVEHIAVAGELGLDDMLATYDEAPLEAAERGGLLRLVDTEGGTRVLVADPVQREVLLEDIGGVRFRRLARTTYELIERRAPLGPGDVLQTAALRLDADGTAPVELLMSAAAVAREARDLPMVERLCRAALVQGPDPAPALLLGEALYENGSFEEADALLSAAAAQADDPAAVAGIVAAHAAVLAFGLDRHADAVGLVRAAESRATDGWSRGLLRARNIMHTLWADGPVATEGLRAETDGLDEGVLRSSLTTVDALSGATGRAVDSVIPDDQGIVRLPAVAELLALTEHGSLLAAETRARELYKSVVATHSPLAQVWVAHALGRVALARGRPATARRWFQEQFALSREAQQALPSRLAVAGVSVAAAWLCDDDALVHYEQYDDGADLSAVGQLFPADVAVGRAWRAQARGEVAAAAEILVAAGTHSLAIGSPGQAAAAAHTLVRFGRPADAVPLLDKAAKLSDSRLVAAFAQHARAAVASDVDALEAVAHDLAGLGSTLAAAEAAAHGAAAAAATGERRRAQALQNLSTVWAAECEGAMTPALTGDAGLTQSPLTRREREIAALVAQGLPSREVADRLFLSVRTVDNHLQRVFTKLGVTSRSEVDDALRRTGQARGAA